MELGEKTLEMLWLWARGKKMAASHQMKSLLIQQHYIYINKITHMELLEVQHCFVMLHN